jgi:hypothetical protein
VVYAASGALTCSVGQWSERPPVCQRMCPVLVASLNSGNCVKSLFVHAFDANAVEEVKQYEVTPSVPAAAVSQYWNITAGTLLTGAGRQCSVNTSTPSFMTVASPTWLDLQGVDFPANFSFSVTATSGMLRACLCVLSFVPLLHLVHVSMTTVPLQALWAVS